jgi:hypothetical protein
VNEPFKFVSEGSNQMSATARKLTINAADINALVEEVRVQSKSAPATKATPKAKLTVVPAKPAKKTKAERRTENKAKAKVARKERHTAAIISCLKQMFGEKVPSGKGLASAVAKLEENFDAAHQAARVHNPDRSAYKTAYNAKLAELCGKSVIRFAA